MSDPNVQQQAENGAETEAQASVEGEESLEKVREQRDEYLDLLKRSRAEFENYQKRNQREREQERRFMHKGFALDLLPVIDNLERALAAARSAADTSSLVEGVNITHSQLIDILRRHGITHIDALGQPFDPNVHHAVMKQPAQPGQESNTVVQVIENGYMIHELVLRPSVVIVAVAEQPGAGQASKED